ncbi:hypothetical protein GCWU000282_02140 [Catonella morbi ATCC 51271]|uniref:Uncharacterized protein n=1 Tax=Catonella morbi ATCC 51271 TaxID=592026 RepID=V2Y6E4_9FIRM|nr:hypothetical protein GCWU000282_02140 [Catonella morbi ATCC 51271]
MGKVGQRKTVINNPETIISPQSRGNFRLWGFNGSYKDMRIWLID